MSEFLLFLAEALVFVLVIVLVAVAALMYFGDPFNPELYRRD